MDSDKEEIDVDFDRIHILHLYTPMVGPSTCYPVESVHGLSIKTLNNKELIDEMSS